MAFGYHFYMEVEGVERRPQHYGTRAGMMDYFAGLLDGSGVNGSERLKIEFSVMEQGVGDSINFLFELPDSRVVRYWSTGK